MKTTAYNLAICMGLLLASSPAPGQAQETSSNADGTYNDVGYGNYPRVTELEQQLLGKTFVNQPLPERVGRLEVKAFGKASTGDLADRLDKLDATVKPKNAVDGYGDNPASDTFTSASGDGTSSSAAVPASSGAPSANSTGDASTPGNGGYPRVTELEQKLLGKTYESDPLPERLARLETKKFGKTTPNDALCDRLDRLSQGLIQNGPLAEDSNSDSPNEGTKRGGLGRSILGLLGGALGGGGPMGMGPMGMGPGLFNEPSAPTPAAAPVIQNPFLPGEQPVAGVDNRIAVMERFVFGHEHADKPIDERVAHLEKKLVPYEHHKADEALPGRVNHLWSMLAAANGQAR